MTKKEEKEEKTGYKTFKIKVSAQWAHLAKQHIEAFNIGMPFAEMTIEEEK